MLVEKMIRPQATVLPESAQLPDRNMLNPPPNQFTHEIATEQPYYYMGIDQAAAPEGAFAQGTKVALLRQDDAGCWVADGRGLYVATACSGLRLL